MLYPDANAEDVILSMKKTSSKLLIVVDKILSMYEMNLPDSFEHPIILLSISEEMAFFPRLLARKKASYSQKNLKLHTISWSELIRDAGKDYHENHDENVPAFMLRTGGTTDIPKEVVLTNKNFNTVSTGVYHSQQLAAGRYPSLIFESICKDSGNRIFFLTEELICYRRIWIHRMFLRAFL